MKLFLRGFVLLSILFVASCNDNQSEKSSSVSHNLEVYATAKLDLEEKAFVLAKDLERIKTSDKKLEEALRVVKGFLKKEHTDTSATIESLNYIIKNGKKEIPADRLKELKEVILKLISCQQPVFS
jgi:hypothetical protein